MYCEVGAVERKAGSRRDGDKKSEMCEVEREELFTGRESYQASVPVLGQALARDYWLGEKGFEK